LFKGGERKLNLREFRKSKGYQRKFIAESVGICGKHLNDVEAGKVSLTDKVCKKLSTTYCISMKKVREMYREGLHGKIIKELGNTQKTIKTS
jgi:DNA-binding XRE family transcriptional regulator